MRTTAIEGYDHIALQEGACGGRPALRGTRLEPWHLVSYGTREEILASWNYLSELQVEEAFRFCEEHKQLCEEFKESQQSASLPSDILHLEAEAAARGKALVDVLVLWSAVEHFYPNVRQTLDVSAIERARELLNKAK